MVDVNSIYLPQPIPKEEFCIQIPFEFENPCNLEEVELVSKPVRITTPFSRIIDPSYQTINPHVQHTYFQVKIKNRMFKPLRLPYHLNPYPLDFFKYLPRFSGDDYVTAERHLGDFENFLDQFEIVHDDVIMRIFSKTLFRNVAAWFKGLRADSISSWIELSNTFLKHWGENKYLHLFLADFYALKREEHKTFPIFNRRFYNTYHDIPLEIRPTETAAMIYYVMGLHSKLALLLLERKYSSLSILFEDDLEVEENICASRRIP